MSTPYARNVVRAPGRLVLNPTDLTAAYPYGGTELGVVRDLLFRPGIEVERLIAEEWKTAVASIVKAEYAVLAGVLRSWDDDMLNMLFPNVSTGSVTGKKMVEGLANSGNRTAGYDMAAKAGKVLFVPDARNDGQFLVLYRAIPVVDQAAQLSFQIGEEYGLAFMFEAVPDHNGRTYRIALKDDLEGLLT